MSISLSKGGNINLAKTAPGLEKIHVGLGWDPRTTDGSEFDLDASVLVCDDDGKVLGDEWFVFYNNLTSPDGSVQHQGDNRDGEGEGDDEEIHIDLANLSPNAGKIVFVVSIHDAGARQQNFGQVAGSFIRIVNLADNAELARYDLGEDYATEVSMNFGELYRHNGEWKFRAVGQGYSGGLASVLADYGLNAS